MIRFKETDYFIENSEYSRETMSPEFTVLNWNIQKKNSSPKWSDEFKSVVERYSPSVILLQECQFVKGLEKLLHMEHLGFIFAPNFIDIFKNNHSGVLTASHCKHSHAEVIKSHAFEPLIRVPKIFLATKYRIDNSDLELLVLNIHAINFVGFWKFISQVQQIEFAIKCHKGPVVLSGDFNTWNRRRIRILHKIVTEAGLIKVDFSVDEKNIKKFLFTHPLDHIYYRGLEFKEDSKALKTRSSDHNPLLVHFKLDSGK